MTKAEIIEKIQGVIYDCFPDMVGQELRGDTVINNETWKKMQTVDDVADAIMKRLPRA